MLNVDRTIISQYATAPVINQLINNMNAYIDPQSDINAFYSFCFNLDAAVGFGLDIWGRIVDVGRVLQVPNDEIAFGFEEASVLSAAPFNQGTFYAGGSLTNNFALSDDAYRLLILAKGLANICDGSIPAINQILRNLFPNRGNCYCTDGLDMTMTYTFEFPLSPVEQAIVGQSGVLPSTSGVVTSVVVI